MKLKEDRAPYADSPVTRRTCLPQLLLYCTVHNNNNNGSIPPTTTFTLLLLPTFIYLSTPPIPACPRCDTMS